jgi:hypothetical protein
MSLRAKPNFAYAVALIELALWSNSCLESREVLACYQ